MGMGQNEVSQLNWMVNTKLDFHICGPTSVFHFDPHPNMTATLPLRFPGSAGKNLSPGAFEVLRNGVNVSGSLRKIMGKQLEHVGNSWKFMETSSFEGSKPGRWGVPDLRHSQNMAKATISRGFRRWTWWCSCSSLAQWVVDWSHILWSWFVTLPSDSHWMSLKYSTGTPLLIWLVAWVSTWRNEVRNFHMDLTPNLDTKQHGCVF